MPSRKIKFFQVFSWCKERPQIVMLGVERLGRLKWRASCFEAFLSFFSTSQRCKFFGLGYVVDDIS